MSSAAQNVTYCNYSAEGVPPGTKKISYTLSASLHGCLYLQAAEWELEGDVMGSQLSKCTTQGMASQADASIWLHLVLLEQLLQACQL